ncbi:MAG: aminotransferase class V-fold PLP-dependent enzyme [Phycisphaerales bacterium]
MGQARTIYLNNAATTWPKPECVYAAVDQTLRQCGSPRRDSRGGPDPVAEARHELGELLGAPDEARLVITPGCTYALNLAILGLPWEAGDVAIMSGLEHHAVSRPIRKAAREFGIRFEVAPYSLEAPVDLAFVEETLKKGDVRLVACSMASNVTGQILPYGEMVRLAHKYGALCLLDAAQLAGVVPMNIGELGADLVAFAGHKALMGPPGVGGLWIGPAAQLRTLAEGGTGGDSGTHAMSGAPPKDYEVGTLNGPAIAGLGAGVRWIREVGIDAIHARESALTGRLINGLGSMDGVTVHGPGADVDRTSVVSFTLDGVTPKEASERLCEGHGIVCRSGYHCAPLAHETIGTHALGGTVRMSPGYFTTEAEIDAALEGVAQIVGRVAARG